MVDKNAHLGARIPVETSEKFEALANRYGMQKSVLLKWLVEYAVNNPNIGWLVEERDKAKTKDVK